MTNVEILLNVLNTSGEASFSNTLYSFMEAGLLSSEEFREVIGGARNSAFANGVQDEKDACVRICKEMSATIERRGGSVHPDNIAWAIRNR